MDARAAELLDFPAILRELEGLALSAQGRERLAGEAISSEPGEVERRKELAAGFREWDETTDTGILRRIRSLLDRRKYIGNIVKSEVRSPKSECGDPDFGLRTSDF